MEPLSGNTADPQTSDSVSTKLERIATRAEQMPETALRTLNHCLDRDLLLVACLRTRKDAAVGVDGETYEDFQENLFDRLDQLVDQAHTGLYRAPPVRRVYISKGGSSTEKRPLGIPAFADKVLQRAVAMILEPIYEHDFHEGSYGFRPGRSAHQAIDDLRGWLNRNGGGWVLDVDVRKYFDTIDHAHLREFLRRRFRDGVLLRLIGKWLNAGVLEEGAVWYPDEGTPQGGVISPLLANIYLHYVLDEWFEEQVKPVLAGEAKLIRFADDFVLAFTKQRDAERVFAVLGKRFAKYGLTIHPEKTRLVRFERPRRGHDSSGGGRGKPETFDLLGFTWHWGRTRGGGWTVKTQTASSRIRRTITRIDDWCRSHRHDPIPQQQTTLSRKLHGHYNYYARPGNYYALSRVYRGVLRAWQKWLSRRSWKAHLTWSRFERLLARHVLPLPRIRVKLHPG
ncbi:MAG: group II intron reverse transcriptase/maturase [Thermoanaerobaculia bacterium]